MKRYKVNFPANRNMGTYSTVATETVMETKEENALWDYNGARAHDGLPPLSKLPPGTVFIPIHEEE